MTCPDFMTLTTHLKLRLQCTFRRKSTSHARQSHGLAVSFLFANPTTESLVILSTNFQPSRLLQNLQTAVLMQQPAAKSTPLIRFNEVSHPWKANGKPPKRGLSRLHLFSNLDLDLDNAYLKLIKVTFSRSTQHLKRISQTCWCFVQMAVLGLHWALYSAQAALFARPNYGKSRRPLRNADRQKCIKRGNQSSKTCWDIVRHSKTWWDIVQ